MSVYCDHCVAGGREWRSEREKGNAHLPPATTQSTIPGPGTAGDHSVPSVDGVEPAGGVRT